MESIFHELFVRRVVGIPARWVEQTKRKEIQVAVLPPGFFLYVGGFARSPRDRAVAVALGHLPCDPEDPKAKILRRRRRFCRFALAKGQNDLV